MALGTKIQDLGSATTGTAVSSLTATLALSCSTSSTLLLRFVATNARTVTSVTDSKGNTWTIDRQNTSSDTVALARCIPGSALVAGDTITVNFSGGTAQCAFIVEEWDTHFVPDVGASNSGTASSAADAGTTAATSVAVELVYAAFSITGTRALTAGAGYTTLTSVACSTFVRTSYAEFLTTAATGAQHPTGTFASAGDWEGLVVTYKPSGGASMTPAATGAVFSATATLIAPGKLIPASTGLQASASATFTAGTPKLVPGATGAVFGASATLISKPLLAGSAAALFGASATLSTPAPAVVRASSGLAVREKPPLWLSVLVTPPGGGPPYRWAGDEPDEAMVPSGLAISSSVPGGFDAMSCTLRRRPGIDYGDLERLSDVLVHGAGGRGAWEGRLTDAPDVSGDEMAVTPDAVGHKAHLEDDSSASMVFIDGDLSRWTGPGAQRRLNMITAGSPPSDPSAVWDQTGPALELAVQGAWVPPNTPSVEAWYDAGPGNTIARLLGNFSGWPDPAFNFLALVCSDAVASAFLATADLYGGAPGSFSFTPASLYRYGLLAWAYNTTPAGGDGQTFALHVTDLKVIGPHGLPVRGTGAAIGFFASDLAGYAIPKWAPLLKVTPDSIAQTSYVIPQTVYYDATNVGAMLDDFTRYSLEDWAVWDKKTFWLYPRGTVGKRWRARVGPSKLKQTGQSSDRLWNGVMVTYRDVDGTTRIVGPPGSGADVTDPTLLDSDPENPANKKGIHRYSPPVAMNIPSVSGAAIRVGARYLQECKALSTAGSAELVGTVYDDVGVEWPAWMVRGGDTISFVDAHDTSERRIVKASYSADTLTTQIDLDAPPQGLDAILARLGLSVLNVQ